MISIVDLFAFVVYFTLLPLRTIVQFVVVMAQPFAIKGFGMSFLKHLEAFQLVAASTDSARSNTISPTSSLEEEVTLVSHRLRSLKNAAVESALAFVRGAVLFWMVWGLVLELNPLPSFGVTNIIPSISSYILDFIGQQVSSIVERAFGDGEEIEFDFDSPFPSPPSSSFNSDSETLVPSPLSTPPSSIRSTKSILRRLSASVSSRPKMSVRFSTEDHQVKFAHIQTWRMGVEDRGKVSKGGLYELKKIPSKAFEPEVVEEEPKRGRPRRRQVVPFFATELILYPLESKPKPAQPAVAVLEKHVPKLNLPSAIRKEVDSLRFRGLSLDSAFRK